MKKLHKLLLLGAVCATVSACDLNYDPEECYSDVTEGVEEGEAGEIVFKDKASVESYVLALNKRFSTSLEPWYLDQMLIQETHSDNCYSGSDGSECRPMENNSVDATNYVLERDWNLFLTVAAEATKLICNIDKVGDHSLSADEINRYRAQAEILRAMAWFDMVRLWGNIPVVTGVPENITADNIDEVYPLYFPEQATEEEAYKAIESDLLDAVKYAPAQTADKGVLSVNVARTLLAKVYAEKPIRDYSKVITYVDQIAADGFDLNETYGDLWRNDGDVHYDSNATGRPLMSNTKESIFEATFSESGDNWCTWMFGYDESDINGSIDWAKWCAPSRGLIKAFTDAGDTERYEQCIVWREAIYSNHYPQENYPFIYKARSKYTNVIKYRFADVLLLKAEALIMGPNTDLAGAAEIIDRIRKRAGLDKLPANVRSNKDALLDAYLNERRLELAFEQQRWSDLVRLDKMEEVMNAAAAADPQRENKRRYTEKDRLLPIAQAVLDKNQNLKQNPGY